MTNELSDEARRSAAKMIVKKRDELLAERDRLTQERQDLLLRTRRNDRELADCRAAARLFELQIEFPADEREEMERQMEARRAQMLAREREDRLQRERPQLERVVHQQTTVAIAKPGPTMAFDSMPPELKVVAQKSRPPLREVVLAQLKAAGPQGAKAAAIRDYIERTYGEVLHEKTVGMTLYRLSQKKLVRPKGQTWFFVPQSAETANPGAVTPGPNNSAT